MYAVPALATPCDFPAALVILSGQVTNAYGSVSGAYVTLQKASDGTSCGTVITNSFGYYSFAPVFTQSYVVTVSKKGCEGYQNAFTLNDDRTENVALTCDEMLLTSAQESKFGWLVTN